MATRIKLILTAIFWGGTFIAGRVVVKEMDPFSAAFLRFTLASAILLLITWKVEGKFPLIKGYQILPLILLGMTGIFAYNVFFFSGLYYVTAGRAAIIIANNPIFISLLSAYFFKEKLTWFKVSGIFMSVSGAIVVISHGNLNNIFSGQLGWGEFFILLCVVTWVLYSLVGKTVMVNLSPLVSVTYSCVVGTVALFFPAYFKGLIHNIGSYSSSVWFSLFYLGFFGTVLGFLWYYEGIKKIGPMKASIFINFVPISTIVLAYLILREPITISLLLGAILVSAGVYLTNVSRLGRNRNKIPGKTISPGKQKET